MNLIPDWWGITVAIVYANNEVIFYTIREPGDNQVGVSIARLLWREEALQMLEEHNKATGVRSSRVTRYRRLGDTIDVDALEGTSKIYLACL